jgi:hypothetical protein
MGRRIETGPRRGAKAAAPMGAPPTIDDFLARLVKYIPTEIVGLYVAAAGFVPQQANHLPDPLLWWVFGACAVLTPVYLWRVTRDPIQGKGPLWIQIILGSVAFVVWVFALPGPFVLLPWYRANVASLVLLFVTFGFGLIQPPPGE